MSRCVIIRGWAFASDGQALRAIRLRAKHVTLAGVVGLPRPDVKAALSDAPDDNTGFEIRGTLPSGKITLAIDAAFADGLSLAVWLAGEDSGDCCLFKGGPYTESRFFGEGVGIAVRKEDADLRRAMDWALARLSARGVYAEIYLKYFPVGFY